MFISNNPVVLKFFEYPKSIWVQVFNSNGIGIIRKHRAMKKPTAVENNMVYSDMMKKYPNARICDDGARAIMPLDDWMKKNSISGMRLAS